MKSRYLTIFLVSCALVFDASGIFGAEDMDINEQIKALEKKIQKAADVQAIKNLMSSMQHHFAMFTSGVTKTPGQCFGQNDGYMYGDFRKRISQNRAKMQGSTQGGPSGSPSGSLGEPGDFNRTLDFHILTTSVIEIAEDGKTAKAVWYAPGVLAEPKGPGSEYMSSWIYELYACDFVKEDGAWKTWHRTLSTDFMSPPTQSWTDSFDTRVGQDEVVRIGRILESTKSREFKPQEAAEGEPQPVSDAAKDIKTVAYQSWTENTLPQYRPKPPTPYKTFNKTFSYCPPMPEDVRKKLESENIMF